MRRRDALDGRRFRRGVLGRDVHGHGRLVARMQSAARSAGLRTSCICLLNHTVGGGFELTGDYIGDPRFGAALWLREKGFRLQDVSHDVLGDRGKNSSRRQSYRHGVSVGNAACRRLGATACLVEKSSTSGTPPKPFKKCVRVWVYSSCLSMTQHSRAAFPN